MPARLLDLDDADAIDFVHRIGPIVEGAIEATSPDEVYVVKVDGWFGARWLGFSHKALGAFGIARRVSLRIPPFVPARVVSQRYVARTIAGDYEPDEAPQALHVVQTSEDNDRRLVARLCPRAALFWWSGQTRRDGRGALMAYLPTADGHVAWYAELAAPGWSATQTVGTSRGELEGLARGGFSVPPGRALDRR